MRKYIDGLSRNKLERLLDQLLEQNDDLELINYISERIKTIDKLNVDFEHFSSDRIIPHSAEDEEKLDAFMREFHVRDFLFLINSFSSTSSANRRKVFFYDGEFCLPFDFTLKQLDDFFKDDFNKKEYDGVFNTLNFIKNRFYEVGCGSVFENHEEKKKIYDIVYNAHILSSKALKPGVKCSDIDKIARDYIESFSYKDYFIHSLGHGVGLDIHEFPTLSTKSEDVLKEGMVVTVEPGLYFKNKFGIRIEDTYIITNNGAESIAKIDKNLIII